MKNTELKGLTCFKVKLKVDRSPLSESMKYLILESDPNPDYYAMNNFPPNKEHVGDRHLYLLIKNPLNCFQDVILRNTAIIREKSDFTMHIYPGYMTYHNKDYQCIRLDTDHTDQLPFLIEELQKLGIDLIKDKNVHIYSSLIYFKKYIEYLKIEEGVYQDSNNSNRFFFQIEKHIDFEEFINGMVQIKNSCDFHLFDSFLADIFIGDKVLDFIGVYSEHCDRSRFVELKREIHKVFLTA